jgi:hypothetical protein
MTAIFHEPFIRVSTISSAPAEFTARPRNWPCAILVDVVHATSPRTVTLSGASTGFTDRANSMSLER